MLLLHFALFLPRGNLYVRSDCLVEKSDVYMASDCWIISLLLLCQRLCTVNLLPGVYAIYRALPSEATLLAFINIYCFCETGKKDAFNQLDMIICLTAVRCIEALVYNWSLSQMQ